MREDHPRACGENAFPAYAQQASDGSPPRVRGKREFRSRDEQGQRITPARAGKTLKPIVGCDNYEDHPRACGENAAEKTLIPSGLGSPPRVRGKPNCRLASQMHGRITPARAGKTP